MKKLIVISMIVALTLLAGGSLAPAQPQEPTNEEKPTFYRLVPGTYVNGWPRFNLTYPKDWVEKLPLIQEVFRAHSPGGTGEGFSVIITPFQDRLVDDVMRYFKIMVKELSVTIDKPSQLSNGTPAREIQIRGITGDGLPFNYSCLSVKHSDVLIVPQVFSISGGIGEHLKAILYSLQYEPGKDEPVKLSPDVQEFLDRNCNDLISHDVAKAMTHFSDRYLNSGVRKGERERFLRKWIGSITSYEFIITDFIPANDRAHLTGFVVFNGAKFPLYAPTIIKENGEWKWYGNQRDAAPWP